MDIDRSNFWHKLPSIIECISLSDMISIDLEMSGIARKNAEERANPSLRQMYEDARHAAETFCILQIGLTCISWDDEGGSYVTKTFNIPLSPAIVGGDNFSDELARTLEREIGFSSKTIAFLQQNDFKFSHIFDKGVPYLSAAEAAQDEIISFVEKKSLAKTHINIGNCPHETQQFYKAIRCKIEIWLSTRVFQEHESNALTLRNPYGGRFHRFQKRLVHQLVDTSFYGFRAHFKNGNTEMEISPRNMDEDPKHDARVKAKRKLAVAKQTGFRYVWEALCGLAIANKIDTDLCSLIVGAIPEKINALRGQLLECEGRLKKERPIFVGHNMLWDLCFLFKTFNGTLPESVEAFQRLVGDSLPRIVDTKYLFTRGGHEMMPDQSLMECFTAVDGEMAPLVRAEPLYRYENSALHQAGYDSYITAIAFLKKAYRIFHDKHGLEIIPREDPGELTRRNPTMPPVLSNHFANNDPSIQPRRRQRKRGLSISCSLLDDTDEDDDRLADLAKKFEPLKPVSHGLTISVSNPDIPSTKSPTAGKKCEEKKDKRQVDMRDGPAKLPDWNDGVFWKRYGCKVRVGHPGLMLYTGKM